MTSRAADLRKALWLSSLSIGWSGVVGSVAVAAAVQTGSLALLGFGADAVIDAVASIVLVWRFTIETREPHRAVRVEQAAERAVGWALIALAAYLVVGGLRALAAQDHPGTSTTGAVLLVASIVVLPPLAIAKHRVATRMASGALRADAILTAVAAILALISLASIVAYETLGLWWADAVAALIVSIIVVREARQSLSAGPAA
jgi:divalent metal cation (Fe/Co/Zn/Cd) transporter